MYLLLNGLDVSNVFGPGVQPVTQDQFFECFFDAFEPQTL